MAIEIEGSKLGGGVARAVFNRNSKLYTSAETAGASHFASRTNALCFSVISHFASAAATNTVFYFQNTSTTRDFYVEIIRVGAVNAALWKVFKVTGTAAGGSVITPVNVNIKSGITAEANARGAGSITGLTQAGEISFARTGAANDKDIHYDETLILGANSAIAVEYTTGTTGIADVFMRGYYREKD